MEVNCVSSPSRDHIKQKLHMKIFYVLWLSDIAKTSSPGRSFLGTEIFLRRMLLKLSMVQIQGLDNYLQVPG